MEEKNQGAAAPQEPMRYAHRWRLSAKGVEVCDRLGCGIVRRLDGKGDKHLCAAAVRLEEWGLEVSAANAPTAPPESLSNSAAQGEEK